MPGCVLRISGEEFNPDKFLEMSTLVPYKVMHRGDQVCPVGPRSDQVFEYGGFKCDVSEIDGNLEGQIADAIRFLKENRADLQKLRTETSVQSRWLDFGIDCRIDRRKVVVQGEYLPIELIKLCGELDIEIGISIYPASIAQASE